jgi:K+-transporting ATPase ATPase A chain
MSPPRRSRNHRRSIALGSGRLGQVVAVLALVVILHVPLGNYMARVYTGMTSWRVELVIYRIVGVPTNGGRNI